MQIGISSGIWCKQTGLPTTLIFFIEGSEDFDKILEELQLIEACHVMSCKYLVSILYVKSQGSSMISLYRYYDFVHVCYE